MIRAAVEAESEMLTALARRSKAHWGYDSDTLALMETALAITPDTISHATVLVHETAGVVDGVTAIEVDRGDWELAHLWVDPERIRSGIGRRLVAALVERARDAGVSDILIHADPNATGFYRRLGAVQIGYRESDVIPGRQLPLLRLSIVSHGPRL